mmetsp:Transcript_38574/g.78827  ORF Transcript_38574/g.78827 Transcript_38574/m.78827 type:complete len:225 (+) Transcript_38574:49-723(+)
MTSSSNNKMCLALLVLVATLSNVAAFAPLSRPISATTALSMSDDSGGTGGSGSGSGGALVAVNEDTIEFSAGTIGGIGGLLIGGPVLGVITGCATNYLSRKDIDTASEAVKGIAEKGIGIYNYVGKLLVDNDIVGKAKDALGNSNPEALDTVESTWKTVSEKSEELGVADIASKTLSVAGDTVEKLVDSALGAAEEYGVADKVKAASSEALDKAKKAADEAVAK